MSTIYTGEKADNLTQALKAYGTYVMRDKSNYPLTRAQHALKNRTHYVDPDTLKYFKARVLDCTISHHGFYCLIQESLTPPGYSKPVRRNVLLNVFGSVVYRSELRTSPKATTKEYSELCGLMDSEFATVALTITLRDKIAYNSQCLAKAMTYIA